VKTPTADFSNVKNINFVNRRASEVELFLTKAIIFIYIGQEADNTFK